MLENISKISQKENLYKISGQDRIQVINIVKSASYLDCYFTYWFTKNLVYFSRDRYDHPLVIHLDDRMGILMNSEPLASATPLEAMNTHESIQRVVPYEVLKGKNIFFICTRWKFLHVCNFEFKRYVWKERLISIQSIFFIYFLKCMIHLKWLWCSSTMPVTIVSAHGPLLDLPHIASCDWVFFFDHLNPRSQPYRRPPFSCSLVLLVHQKTQQSPSGVYMMKFRPCFPVSRMDFFHPVAPLQGFQVWDIHGRLRRVSNLWVAGVLEI